MTLNEVMENSLLSFFSFPVAKLKSGIEVFTLLLQVKKIDNIWYYEIEKKK